MVFLSFTLTNSSSESLFSQVAQHQANTFHPLVFLSVAFCTKVRNSNIVRQRKSERCSIPLSNMHRRDQMDLESSLCRVTRISKPHAVVTQITVPTKKRKEKTQQTKLFFLSFFLQVIQLHCASALLLQPARENDRLIRLGWCWF